MLKDTILELCAQRGPSGFEGPVAERCRALLDNYMDETRIDVMGNVIGVRRCGKQDAKKLLLDAHIDEIGLIVTSLEKGFLRFSAIGGVDPRMLPDREVLVLTDPPLPGVVCCMPPHVLSAEEMNKAQAIKDLYIDIGLDEETAAGLVSPGTPVVFRGSAEMLGEDAVCGKSLDDRACFAILLRTLELLQQETLDVDLYVMGSTQEELGMRGAKTGVFSIDPDCAVAVDVTHAHTPDAPKDRTMKFGGGPVIGYGPVMDRAISRTLTRLAEQQGIEAQTEVMATTTGTNAWAMQVSREGVRTAVVSLPLKYMHSPVETVLLSDGEAVAQLLAGFVRSAGEVL